MDIYDDGVVGENEWKLRQRKYKTVVIFSRFCYGMKKNLHHLELKVKVKNNLKTFFLIY